MQRNSDSVVFLSSLTNNVSNISSITLKPNGDLEVFDANSLIWSSSSSHFRFKELIKHIESEEIRESLEETLLSEPKKAILKPPFRAKLVQDEDDDFFLMLVYSNLYPYWTFPNSVYADMIELKDGFLDDNSEDYTCEEDECDEIKEVNILANLIFYRFNLTNLLIYSKIFHFENVQKSGIYLIEI